MTNSPRLFPASLILLGSAIPWAGAANASSTATDVSAKFVLAGTCTAATSGLDFGTLPASLSIASNVDTTATVTVRCFNSLTYKISSGTGLYANGSQKRMSANGPSGPFLDYGIYSNSGRTNAFAVLPANSGNYTGTGADQVTMIYARLPIQAATAAGTYSDTLTFTITF